MTPIPVHLYHLSDCRGAELAARLIPKVAEQLGIAIDLQMILVENPEQARDLRFPGSPTIRIRGLDIEPSARNVDYVGHG